MVFRQFLFAVPLDGFGVHLEAIGHQARVDRSPVLARAADAGAGEERAELANGARALVRAVAQRDGVGRWVLHHVHAHKKFELVHAVDVVGHARAAALENGDRQRRAPAQFLGHEQASPAAADDEDVGRGKCLHDFWS